MYKGHCLCGAVNYRYEGPLGPLTLCHCEQCQRSHGSAFSATAPVQTVHVQWSDRSLITEFESSPGRYRAFCARCGSALYHRVDAIPGLLRLSISSLSDTCDLRVDHETHIVSEAEWFASLEKDSVLRYPAARRNSEPST